MSKWDMVRLGDVCVTSSGGTPKSDRKEYYKDGTISWLKSGEVAQGVIFKTEDKITAEGMKNSSAKLFPPNTVVVAMYGATVGQVGLLKIESTTNQAVCGILPCDKFLPEFLYSILKNKKKYLISLSAGGAQPNISQTIIKNLKLPLPPLEEQKKIAQELDSIQSLIAKRKEQLEKIDLLVKAKFVEMFGDPVANPMGWEVEKLYHLGELNRGVSKHRPRNDPKLLGGEYPLIQTGEVANSGLYITSYSQTYSELGLKQSKLWEKGTLCITIAANIAKTAILTFDACFPDSIVGFISNEKTNQIFIYYWFTFFQGVLEAQAPECAQKNINMKILNDLNVVTPPIDLQNKFADYVQQSETLKTTMHSGLEKLELLYNSKMQEYFE